MAPPSRPVAAPGPLPSLPGLPFLGAVADRLSGVDIRGIQTLLSGYKTGLVFLRRLMVGIDGTDPMPNFNFSNIPQNYTHLLGTYRGLTSFNADDDIWLQFSGDFTVGDYFWQRFRASGGAVSTDTSGGGGDSRIVLGRMPGTGQSFVRFGSGWFVVLNYARAEMEVFVVGLSFSHSATLDAQVSLGSWQRGAPAGVPVTSVNLLPNNGGFSTNVGAGGSSLGRSHAELYAIV